MELYGFSASERTMSNPPGEISLRNADWIIVTADKIEYFGWLAAYSTHEQKREIVLGDHEIIVRDERGDKAEAIPCGKQLIIPEEKIAHVVVVSYKKTFWERRKDESVKKGKNNIDTD
jgi:hypothetical protein